MTQDFDFKKPSAPAARHRRPITPMKPISQPAMHLHSSLSPASSAGRTPRSSSETPTPGRGRPLQPRSANNSRSRSRSTFSPDRFIPSSLNIQSFRMGIPAERLSTEERYSRKRSASPDPFSRRRENSPRSRRAASSFEFGTAVSGSGGTRRRSRSSDPTFRGEGRRGMNVIEANMFSDDDSEGGENEKHEERLALALGVDRANKVFNFSGDPSGSQGGPRGIRGKGKATTEGAGAGNAQIWGYGEVKYTILDAPGLRDDFYCSLIAYSPTTNVIAVGLDTEVYSWNENVGVMPLRQRSASHVTTLAFSSPEGGNEILAVGRMNGTLYLQAIDEDFPRKQVPHQFGIACVSWRPVLVERRTIPGSVGRPRKVEELLAGDEMGNLYYYCVEWDGPEHGILPAPVDATLMLIRRISIHSQQVCGIAWAPDGSLAATGGNDNTCILLDTEPTQSSQSSSDAQYADEEIAIRYCWVHKAAVKAIAFCPWQRGLLATGGGSNDRCIRFHHTFSGTTLTTINVSAQVTSVIWSNKHREIAACFGYSNPEHPIRIAVFSWPDCTQILSVPWGEDMRALYAIPYPGTPGELPNGDKPTHDDGCIVVVSSDERIRFHEVWSGKKRTLQGLRGVLGGSDILEGLEGIEKDVDLIR